ncbi:MAG: hypothetical protein ACUVRZ_05075 [Desulfobacca sp.]|uniref:hypothetical protein n=1 Tax=Desulfobacca sp. TaxID=2067990 RepID=UPI00404A995F
MSKTSQVRKMLATAFADQEKITPEMVQQYLACLLTRGATAALRETAKQLFWEDVDASQAKARGLDLPVLIIWGAQDRVLPPASSKRLSADIPGPR